MLKVENQEYFDKVKQFAESTGQLAKLQKKLDFLDSYACHDTPEDTQCFLYKDWAPNSFGFTIEKKNKTTGEYKHWFSGGLIYFGSGDSGVGSPQYSVRIGDTSESGWSIHT